MSSARNRTTNEQFQPRGTGCVDQVGERFRDTAHNRHFAVQQGAALDDFIFVFQPREQSPEFRILPQHIRLLGKGDAAGHAMLRQKRRTD